MEGQVRRSRAVASSCCSCCSRRSCMLAELSRRRNYCGMPSGVTSRPPTVPQSKVHRLNADLSDEAIGLNEEFLKFCHRDSPTNGWLCRHLPQGLL